MVGLWNTKDPGHAQRQPICAKSGGLVYAAAFSDDNHLVALATDNGAEVWDIPQHGPPHWMITISPGTGIRSVAFSKDGTLATGDVNGNVRIWNVSHPGNGRFLGLGSFGSVVRALAFSPDGDQLAAGSFDDAVRILDPRSGDTIHQFVASSSPVTDLAYSPGTHRNILAITSDDGIVRLWNPVAGNELLSIPAAPGRTAGIQAVAFNPVQLDLLMVCGADYTLQQWRFTVPDQGRVAPQQQAANLERAIDRPDLLRN